MDDRRRPADKERRPDQVVCPQDEQKQDYLLIECLLNLCRGSSVAVHKMWRVAQLLWNDPDFVEVPATTSGERRYLVIGKISGKHWSAVITYRGHRIRIISVRRSREEEIKIYEI